MSRERDSYGPPPPRRDSMMSRRDDYPSPRDDHYNTKDRYDCGIYMQFSTYKKTLKMLILELLFSYFSFHVKFHSYSSRDFNSRDSRDYGPPPRDYSYRDYPNSGSRDDYGSMSRGYGYVGRLMRTLHLILIWSTTKGLVISPSDRDGYGGGREPRGYMDRPSGGSYRDSYDGYGKI